MRRGRISGDARSLTRGAGGGAGRAHSTAGFSTTAMTATTAGAAFSALTKFFKPWVWHSVFPGLVCGQQPCFCAESRICGQEKQFPQNRAATTSSAMIDVERARMLILLYTDFQVLLWRFLL